MFRIGNLARAALALVCVCSWAHAQAEDDKLLRAVVALQARVERLEAQARRDHAEASKARAELVAARATMAAKAREIPAQDAALVPTSVTPHATATSPFEGPYAGVVAGYDFRTKRHPIPAFASFGNVSEEQLAGVRAGAFAGYNVVAGRLLIGLEGRLTHDFGNKSEIGNSSSFISFPRLGADIGSQCCNLSAAQIASIPLTRTSSFDLTNNSIVRNRLSRSASGELATRVGFTAGDWLFYGKAGAGLERYTFSKWTNDTGTNTCVGPVVTRQIINSPPFPLGYRDVITGCTAVQNGGFKRQPDTSAYAPYVTVGAGVEHNVGPYFVRAEADLLSHFSPIQKGFPAAGVYYSTELTGAVGYRF